MGVLSVLAVVDKVLSNRRVQGVLTGKPQPPTCGQDQRLDVLIEEVQRMNARLDDLVELQAAALRLAAEQAGPGSEVTVTLSEPDKLKRRKG